MNERLPSPTLFFQTCHMLAIKKCRRLISLNLPQYAEELKKTSTECCNYLFWSKKMSSVALEGGSSSNDKRIFWGSFIALIACAFGFVVRTLIIGD